MVGDPEVQQWVEIMRAEAEGKHQELADGWRQFGATLGGLGEALARHTSALEDGWPRSNPASAEFLSHVDELRKAMDECAIVGPHNAHATEMIGESAVRGYAAVQVAYAKSVAAHDHFEALIAAGQATSQDGMQVYYADQAAHAETMAAVETYRNEVAQTPLMEPPRYIPPGGPGREYPPRPAPAAPSPPDIGRPTPRPLPTGPAASAYTPHHLSTPGSVPTQRPASAPRLANAAPPGGVIIPGPTPEVSPMGLRADGRPLTPGAVPPVIGAWLQPTPLTPPPATPPSSGGFTVPRAAVRGVIGLPPEPAPQPQPPVAPEPFSQRSMMNSQGVVTEAALQQAERQQMMGPPMMGGGAPQPGGGGGETVRTGEVRSGRPQDRNYPSNRDKPMGIRGVLDDATPVIPGWVDPDPEPDPDQIWTVPKAGPPVIGLPDPRRNR